MHLTNYAINKTSKDFVRDDDVGSKRRISTVNQWFVDNDYDIDKIWRDIEVMHLQWNRWTLYMVLRRLIMHRTMEWIWKVSFIETEGVLHLENPLSRVGGSTHFIYLLPISLSKLTRM